MTDDVNLIPQAIETAITQGLAPLSPHLLVAKSLTQAYKAGASRDPSTEAGTQLAQQLEHANIDSVVKNAVADALHLPEVTKRLSSPSRDAIISAVGGMDVATLSGNLLKTALVSKGVNSLQDAITLGRGFDAGQAVAEVIANSVNNLDLPELPKRLSHQLSDVTSGINPLGNSLSSGLSTDDLPETYEVTIPMDAEFSATQPQASAVDDMISERNPYFRDMSPPKAPPVVKPSRTGFIKNPYFKPKKAQRSLHLVTPLDPPSYGDYEGVLVPTHVTIHQAVGQPGTIEITALSHRDDIEAKDIMGRVCDLKVFVEAHDKDAPTVSQFWQTYANYCTSLTKKTVADKDEMTTYQVTLSSWLTLLRDCHNHRIFQNKTVVKVIDELLKPYADQLAWAEFDLSRIHHIKREVRPFWHQQESSLDYLHRICKEHHISYFIRYCRKSDGNQQVRHVVTFIGEGMDLDKVTEPAQYVFHPGTEAFDHLTAWSMREQLIPTASATKAYDYTNIDARLDVRYEPGKDKTPMPFEVEDYYYDSSRSKIPENARNSVKRDYEQLEGQKRHWVGTGNIRRMALGQFHIHREVNPKTFHDEGKWLNITEFTLLINETGGTAHSQFKAHERSYLPLPPSDGKQRMKGMSTATVSGEPG